MNNKYAVIDLGTNTFHLLAVEKLPNDGFRRLHKERIYVRLAEDGIATIGDAPFKRGVEALQRFRYLLDEHGIKQVRAFGTAALRTASNGQEFVKQVKDGLGIHVETIPGQEEARLIHQGVMQAIGKPKERFVIMDIGGGSVEFIIADKEQVYWSGSFPVGVAVLCRQFHLSDPISEKEVEDMGQHLETMLKPLHEALSEYPVEILVGASGTFEVLANVLPSIQHNPACTEVGAGDFMPFHQKIMGSTVQERLDMESIPNLRVEMIVVALELIRYILEDAGARRILISAYAMKEGILKEFHRKLSKRIFSIRDIDWITAVLYLSLALIGWFMIDAAVFDPDHPTSLFDISTQSGKQGLFVLASVLIGAAILLVDPQLFKTLSYVIYGISIALLLGVLVYGAATNGATSWINLPGGFKFQPSEVAKFATCLALSTYLSSVNASMEAIENVLLSFAIIMVPTILIVIQGDPGSALVFLSLMIVLFREGLHPLIYILGIIFVTLFVVSLVFNPLYVILGVGLISSAISVSNIKSKMWWVVSFVGLLVVTYIYHEAQTLYVLYGVGAFLTASTIANVVKQKRMLAGFLVISTIFMSGFIFSVNYLFFEVLEPHQQDRLNVWLMPEKADPRGSYYNLLQSKLAIGSGGFQGKGHRKGEMTQGNYVPEQHTDFIFTVVGEEQGFIGTFGVIVLYLLLLIRITILAERQRSKFTRIYAYGVAGILSFHLLVNVGMTMGLMPVIGIPLPLMSYGGSSLLSFTVMIAVLIKFDSQRLLVFR